MKRTQYSVARVEIISTHLSEVIRDLRLVDVADYIAFIRCELFGNIADIVNSATELTFYPDTLIFGLGGEYTLDWNSSPRVMLDLEFSNMGVNAYFRLTLSAESAEIDLHHVRFADTGNSPADNTALLASAFEDARLPQFITPGKIG
ncbi:hypothetical protein CU102_14750 [Phyllobacterium brassicacearum]|uniref:Uncharacterized protein n=1 Tax=Phyllobacterium brassicacearum TaxID=314235 RepID=A0A2P7BNY8_9HYPH|nr:hypothetical protein [Phyllobacterium brassicacearum]PSH68179.1 hypothetical protein CU102_14750 [Phyllobacterium brassicacearum]TDQ29586.1 hypothetical protein DEV91_10994 [Phyllobacterium brassicacearum]